jgi:putative ABC transport system permease protein
VDAIVAVLAAGPLGAVVAVLVLGGRLVVERRRPALALVRARGASGAWLRGVVGAEGLVTGLPAAAAGFGLGLLAVPGPVTGTQAALATAAGLAPAAALAGAASGRGMRAERTDLARGPSRGRLRPVLEGLVGLAALASTGLLLERGVVAGTDDLGVDPLLAAAPLLLGVTVTLLAVRAFPWLARGLERTLARRADLVPFLGAARATRDPAGGLVPALALVLAVGVAASSAVLQSTVSAGITREAWGTVGADLRVAGPLVGAEELAALRAVDGVAGVSPVADLGQLALGAGEAGRQVTVYAVDAAALARVQADVPGAPAGLAQLAGPTGAPPGDALPVLVSESLEVGGAAGGLTLGGTPLDVVGAAETLPGAPPATAFVVVDVALASEALGRDAYPRLALLDLDDDLEPGGRERVEDAIQAALPTAVVDDPVAGQAELLAAPSASGLAAAFGLAVALSAVLAAGAVVLTLVLAAPARARLLAVLRTLGLRRRAERGVVAWEIGPWAVVALGVGAVLGWAVPALVLAAVDLTPLTGGAEQPPLAPDPAALGALAGGFAVVVLGGAALAARLGRGDDVARLRAQAD